MVFDVVRTLSTGGGWAILLRSNFALHFDNVRFGTKDSFKAGQTGRSDVVNFSFSSKILRLELVSFRTVEVEDFFSAFLLFLFSKADFDLERRMIVLSTVMIPSSVSITST